MEPQQFADGVWREIGLTDQEYERIVELMGRTPTWPELGIFSAMWSEHCSYKNSKPVLRLFPTQGPRVLQGPGENAGVIDIGDGQAVAFKIESHNHPSALEPFQGAATGVGGIIRDVFTMGARPIAVLDSLRFGDLSQPRVRFLLEGVVSGIAAYGNCIGIPTVGGETFFDASYTGNPLVNAMCVGLIEDGRIMKGIAAGAGNPVMSVGAATGRDGIHGATFASTELSEASEAKRSAVQVGDPFMEKLLLEACLELMQSDAVIGIQDMGAAGLTSSSCEMAARGNSGMDFDVTLVPQREEGMTPYEILLSESQERMLVCVQAGREQDVERIFRKWGLEAVVIGHVTDDGLVTVREHGEVVACIPAKLLTDEAPVYNKPAVRPEYLQQTAAFDPSLLPEPSDFNAALLALLGSPNICSKEWITRQYDHMVRTNTVQRPGGDAAVLRIRGTQKGLGLVTDCNSRFVYLEPYLGGALAVAEAARNLVCVGAEPLAITNCLNFGNPEKPEVFYTFREAVQGMADACRALETPVTGGNVSFYNENEASAVYPTPTVGMVGLLSDINHNTSSALPLEETTLLLVGKTANELGGSEYLATCHHIVSGQPPQLCLDYERKNQTFVLQAIRNGWVAAAHDCAEGGIVIALAEMAIQGGIGLEVTLIDNLTHTASCFSETASRILLAVKPENLDHIRSLAKRDGVDVQQLGCSGGERFRVAHNQHQIVDLPLHEMTVQWKGAMECLLK